MVSGPSGSGKTTLCRRLADEKEAHYSISCTTRLPRDGEIDGKDYHFLTTKDFQSRIDAGEFLEHAKVHENYYGTLKTEVVNQLAVGIDVVMDIDVQGANQVRSCSDSQIKVALIDLFVMPPSEEELRSRLLQNPGLLAFPLDLHQLRLHQRTYIVCRNSWVIYFDQ